MKKILLSMVCLVMVGMQSVNAQVAIAALHKGGKVTTYPAAAIQSAVDDAVAGDTIYLSEGIFGGFTVSKPIVMIGAGQTTMISHDVIIGDQISAPTVAEGLLLSGMNIIQNVGFNGNITGARISQCKIAGSCWFGSSYSENSYDNIEIVMSQIYSLVLSEQYIKGLSVVASKIVYIKYGGSTDGAVTFLNCNINSSGNGNAGEGNNNFVNCIISRLGPGVYQNCLYIENNYGDLAVIYECYNNTDFTLDDNLNCSLTDDELKAAGYLGPDNTWVGIGGGEVKFSLVMPTVQVVEHSVGVNQAERKLNVTLKFGNK